MTSRRLFPATLRTSLLTLVLAAAVLAGGSSTGTRTAHAAGGGKLQVGVLWCALKGTDLATAPVADLNAALWKLHEVATDHVFEPQANITFRSAFVKRMLDKASFKVIDDPAASPGGEGDVRRPDGSANSDDEYLKARNDCRKAYENDINTKAVAIDGIVGIYIRHFVDASGTAFPNTNGQGGYTYTTTGSANLCAEPPTGEFSLNSVMMIEQSVRSLPDAQQGALIGHEFGHALTLDHGNGRDDNANNLVDKFCDPANEGEASAAVCAQPQTVMTPFRCFNSNGAHLEPIQIARAKAAALKVPMTVDPPDPVPGPVISDSRGDDVDDVVQEGLDLMTLTIAQNSETGHTIVAHELFGDAPISTHADYTTFIDTDGNPATGGDPSTLGFATSFHGAELVTSAEVRFHESGEFDSQDITPRVWKFVGGSFTEVTPNPNIIASKDTMQGAETPVTPVDTIWVLIPNDIRGPVTNPLRVQVLTNGRESSADANEQDRLPEAADAAVNIRLIAPDYPTCSVSPDPIRPGAIATTAFTGLIPSAGAHVVFGSDPIATGTSDAQGNGSIQFRVPPDSRLGFRLVTVGSDGTALTGDCSVMVAGTPVNLPPELTVPGPQTVQYSDALTFGVSATDPDNDPIALAATGLPSAFTFTDNGNGTGTVSGTAQVAAGTYPVTFLATDASNPAVSKIVNIVVTREDAVVTPSAANPTAVKVAFPGGTAPPVVLSASIVEVADGSLGNISNAVPVTFTLTPLLAGAPRTCTATTSGGGVGGTLTATCSFFGLPVDVYDVSITIGGTFYQGAGETVLVVYDPSLGFVTGGGKLTHNGVRANFGFNTKYLKNGRIQGSLLYIEHAAAGRIVLKSNAMQSLVVVGNSAVIIGKATLNGVGNYEFRATVVDNGEPGTADRFGLQIRDRNGALVTSLTFAPVVIDGGNIVVPHTPGP